MQMNKILPASQKKKKKKHLKNNLVRAKNIVPEHRSYHKTAFKNPSWEMSYFLPSSQTFQLNNIGGYQSKSNPTTNAHIVSSFFAGIPALIFHFHLKGRCSLQPMSPLW